MPGWVQGFYRQKSVKIWGFSFCIIFINNKCVILFCRQKMYFKMTCIILLHSLEGMKRIRNSHSFMNTVAYILIWVTREKYWFLLKLVSYFSMTDRNKKRGQFLYIYVILLHRIVQPNWIAVGTFINFRRRRMKP